MSRAHPSPSDPIEDALDTIDRLGLAERLYAPAAGGARWAMVATDSDEAAQLVLRDEPLVTELSPAGLPARAIPPRSMAAAILRQLGPEVGGRYLLSGADLAYVVAALARMVGAENVAAAVAARHEAEGLVRQVARAGVQIRPSSLREAALSGTAYAGVFSWTTWLPVPARLLSTLARGGVLLTGLGGLLAQTTFRITRTSAGWHGRPAAPELAVATGGAGPDDYREYQALRPFDRVRVGPPDLLAAMTEPGFLLWLQVRLEGPVGWWNPDGGLRVLYHPTSRTALEFDVEGDGLCVERHGRPGLLDCVVEELESWADAGKPGTDAYELDDDGLVQRVVVSGPTRGRVVWTSSW